VARLKSSGAMLRTSEKIVAMALFTQTSMRPQAS
jgi:hypothetical protein